MLHRLACVSFLNSKPLIDPLTARPDTHIHFAVPAHLLPLVDSGAVSTALLSVVDYHAAQHPLILIPAGMIGCAGPTLTVRLFSRIPPQKIQTLHADTDSHTSIILAQLILHERYGISPAVIPLDHSASRIPHSAFTALLLIGDKVVNAAPDPADYPHQLDLGEEWHNLTGLPFIFAMWMMRKDMLDIELAHLLADARRQGTAPDATEALVGRYSAEKGWPPDLARRYFTEYLRYEVTDRARQGLAHFYTLAAQLNLLTPRRPIEYCEL